MFKVSLVWFMYAEYTDMNSEYLRYMFLTSVQTFHTGIPPLCFSIAPPEDRFPVVILQNTLIMSLPAILHGSDRKKTQCHNTFTNWCNSAQQHCKEKKAHG